MKGDDMAQENIQKQIEILITLFDLIKGLEQFCQGEVLPVETGHIIDYLYAQKMQEFYENRSGEKFKFRVDYLKDFIDTHPNLNNINKFFSHHQWSLVAHQS